MTPDQARKLTREEFEALPPGQQQGIVSTFRFGPGGTQSSAYKDLPWYIKGEAEPTGGEAQGYQTAEIERLKAQMALAEQQKKLGFNADGSPIRPEYSSLLDPKTGLMQTQYQMTNGDLDPTKMEGYQAYKKNALRQGPSDWAKLMLQQQEMKRMGNMEKAAAQASSSGANARASLSMRGGMSSGARERIAKSGARDLLAARQGVGRDANVANIGIQTQDEQDRQGFLKGLPGMEADIEKFNIGNRNKTNEFNIMRALEEKRAKDAQDLTVYQEQLKKWGAERQAQATESSGGGGK